MSSSLSIQPIALSAVPPVVRTSLLTASSPPVQAAFDRASSIVDISDAGFLLSGVSAARERLQAEQAALADSSPASVFATAQGLVDTFNALQSNVASSQTLLTGFSDSLLVDQLALSLNQLASSAIASDSASLARLRGIGIELVAATPGDTVGTLSLQIDPNVLNTAIASDPAGTQALLNQASQSLLEQLTGFEQQAVSAALAQVDLTQLGGSPAQPVDLSTLLGLNTNSTAQSAAVGTDLLQALSADSVLNGVQLSDLDLAAAGLDTATILSKPAVLQGALTAGLLGPDATAATLVRDSGISPTNPASVSATDLSATGTPPPGIISPLDGQAVPLGNPAALADQIGTPGAAPVIADVADAERRASIAAQTLQNLLNSPLDLIQRNLVDPAYAAVIAASRMSDFIMPTPQTNPKLLVTDIPAPVLPVLQARAPERLEKSS
ncbi:hypothetical protein AT959_13190 [Dechloromonas denitrificans]|uniref:Uncharacterized protein n=1 Tax=Dechloromonas denitrificans TaxID=281362 RepID=A0A133XH76_9RHOO|nr:hypothetical protein [Dechloromonas denitrificans]KXB30302.1 hypothetical protein AT959_13190 [Dechloromonas denitrificans]